MKKSISIILTFVILFGMKLTSFASNEHNYVFSDGIVPTNEITGKTPGSHCDIENCSEHFVKQFEVPKVIAIKAYYGDSLQSTSSQFPKSEVGYFCWDDTLYSENTLVGKVGSSTFYAKFVPYAEKSYTLSNIPFQIEVKKAKPPMPEFTCLYSVVGKTLADVSLPKNEYGEFHWNIKSPENYHFDKCGTYTQSASFLVYDDKNYNCVSNIEFDIIVKNCEHENYTDWVFDENSGLFKNGTMTRYCTICGKSETETCDNSSKILVFIQKIVSAIQSLFIFNK